MKPFFILLIVFGVAVIINYAIYGEANLLLSGKIALSIMMIFTSFGHFKFTKGMAMMLPPFVPAKSFIIYVTGVLEIVLAITLFTSFSYYAGWLLIILFIVFLPANVYASAKHINYETAAYDGKGLSYLWFRIPFQLLLIWWTWYFILRPH